MSRPRKIHKPLGETFESVLEAIGMGFGKGKSTPRKTTKKKNGTKKKSNK